MIGTTIHERYRIDAQLGKGGMGTVYRAHDAALQRDVAIKVLSTSGLGTQGRERLLNEARTVASLDHPNIVTVFDVGEVDSTPFIVMELVDGANLHERPPQDLDETTAIARQVCQALEHAHAKGVIHRDLKPENVVITAGGGLKLMDFGLARSVSSRLTEDGAIVGTVAYMSPEQAFGKQIDARADLYSLGVMLYELTTGQLPFVAEDIIGVITQHLNAPVVPPRARNERIPPHLNDLIVRLMHKEPGDRPASAREVLDLLQPAPVPAGATPSAELPGLERIVRGRIIGREKEYQQARDLWKKVMVEGGRSLLISGEPGIGKTRLMQEISSFVEVSGGQALVGACHADRAAPYAPFSQIVREAFRRNPDLGERLPPFVLADLIVLAPGLRAAYPEIVPNPPIDPQTEQQRLFEHFVAFCKALTDLHPVFLVLEDAHWADSGSLSLLLHLARQTGRQRLLLLATYREVELDGTRPFNEILREFAREDLATRIKLARLDRGQTGEMLATLFDEEITPEFLEGIYQETEGNPFFVEEVCKALVDSGRLYFRDGQWHRPTMGELEIPQSVRVAIQTRVSRLPEHVLDTLQLAAVFGREFEFDTLVAASDLDENTIIEALEIAEGDQLITEVRGNRSVVFAFSHALIPATLEEEIRTLRRRRLHKRAAEAIEQRHPEDLAALAHHYGEAGEQEQAVRFLIRAGDQAAAVFANHEAEQHYRAALDGVEDLHERARLLAEIGSMQNRQSQHQQAAETWRQAVALYQELNDPDRIAGLYASMARAVWEAGDITGSLDIARQGLALVEGAPEGPGLARLLADSARSCFFSGQLEEGPGYARRALEMAERVGALEVQAEILNTISLFPSTPVDEKFANLQRAVSLAEEAGFLQAAARAHNNLSVEYLYARSDIVRAAEHLRRGLELAREMHLVSQEVFYGSGLAGCEMLLGKLGEARQRLTELHQLLESVQMEKGPAAWMLIGREVQLLYYQGHLEQAIRELLPLQAATRSAGDIQTLSGLNMQLADAYLKLDRPEEAEPVLLEACQLGDQGTITGGVWPRLLLVFIRAQEGKVEAVRTLLEEARRLEIAWGSRTLDTSCRTWIEMILASMEGRQADAEAAFAFLLDAFTKSGDQVNRNQLLWTTAQGLLQTEDPGEREQVREALLEAQSGFREMGADGYVTLIDQDLAKLEKAAPAKKPRGKS